MQHVAFRSFAGPSGQQYICCWPEGPAKDLNATCCISIYIYLYIYTWARAHVAQRAQRAGSISEVHIKYGVLASNIYIAGPKGQQKIYMQPVAYLYIYIYIYIYLQWAQRAGSISEVHIIYGVLGHGVLAKVSSRET